MVACCNFAVRFWPSPVHVQTVIEKAHAAQKNSCYNFSGAAKPLSQPRKMYRKGNFFGCKFSSD
jgi:hypothetical protein